MGVNRHLPTLRVNGEQISVRPRETLLQAAERAGIDFPNSCRVGGCGTCKCRVTSGKVRELTETGYLLSAEEIQSGHVLACQAIPKGDVAIEVDLAAISAQTHRGTLIRQEKVTHDMTRLTVQLHEPLSYRAGQFANLALDSVPDVVRSYSFATPPQADGQVSFLVREVPGGRFSTKVQHDPLVGQAVTLQGPHGQFYLRQGDGPLLFVAGGSGLAPILAMLQDALEQGIERPVTLLFGAREERDLYGLEEISKLARDWRAPFEFVPVLAQGPWDGAQGLVTEHMASRVRPDVQAYLCGPPGMIDSAIQLLHDAGIPAKQIHFDRFTTQADSVAAVPGIPAAAAGETAPGQAAAGFLDYVKYFAFHVIGLAAAAALFGGGKVATIGLLLVVALYMLGDAVLGDDTSTPLYRRPGILTAQLWLALPLLTLITFAAVWSVSPGDPLGVGALIEQTTGYAVLAAREQAGLGTYFSAFVLTGLMIGMVGTITAHELTHRTWDPVSMVIGRWLLAFSFDTNFAIEHVYGHHRYVSTTHDPATAPRGRNVYHHILASTVRGNLSAWKIEVDRLRKKNLPVWSHHNAVLRGQTMSLVLLGSAFALGGWLGLGFFTLCGLWGKALLEIVNYMEHYGMVRDPATPVQPRHSWNTNRRVSSWTMFNLTRHSHHHAQGEVPYQDLRPYPDAPMMLSGYLTTIILAMVPPLWHRLMTPKVLAWDQTYASPGEQRLAAAANARSGIPQLMRHGLGQNADAALHQQQMGRTA